MQREIFTPVPSLQPTTAAPECNIWTEGDEKHGESIRSSARPPCHSYLMHGPQLALKAFWGHYATSPTHLLLLRLHIFQSNRSGRVSLASLRGRGAGGFTPEAFQSIEF